LYALSPSPASVRSLQQPGGAELRRLVWPDHDGVECLAARADVTGRDLPQLALVEDRVLHLDSRLLREERWRQLAMSCICAFATDRRRLIVFALLLAEAARDERRRRSPLSDGQGNCE
jgi:hypothetical protein